MAIRLDKHLPDRSKEKSPTIFKLAIWVIVAIILIVTIPRSIRYIKNGIANAARSKAEKALTLYMIENAANIDDYTVFLVHHRNKYYMYWYVDKIQALAGFDEPCGFAPPIKFPDSMAYPFLENPLLTEKKLSDNGVWYVLTEINSDAGYECTPFTKDGEEGIVTFRYYSTAHFKEKPLAGVELFAMYVNGDSIKATQVAGKEVDDIDVG